MKNKTQVHFSFACFCGHLFCQIRDNKTARVLAEVKTHKKRDALRIARHRGYVWDAIDGIQPQSFWRLVFEAPASPNPRGFFAPTT